MEITADIVMAIMAIATASGCVVGYLIKQNSRIAMLETKIETLSRLVEKNGDTVTELAITMSAINQKLTTLVDMRHGTS